LKVIRGGVASGDVSGKLAYGEVSGNIHWASSGRVNKYGKAYRKSLGEMHVVKFVRKWQA